MPPSTTPRPQQTTPCAISRMERAAEVFKQRMEGKTLQQIGDALGMSKQAVGQMIRRHVKELRDVQDETREEYICMELERLDGMFNELYPDRHVPRVTEILLKIMERRSKMLGLDAPAKLDVMTTVDTLTPDQQAEEARRIGLTVTAFTVDDAALPGFVPPLLTASPVSSPVSSSLPSSSSTNMAHEALNKNGDTQDVEFARALETPSSSRLDLNRQAATEEARTAQEDSSQRGQSQDPAPRREPPGSDGVVWRQV